MTLSERALESERTRADQVRKRRARVERPVEPARRRTLKKRPHHRRAPRRRHDVQLKSTQGAEIQLPALPSLRVGPRLLSAGLLLFLAWGLGELISAPRFQVNAVEVTGNQLLSVAQIQSVIGFMGEGIFSIDPLEVVERLMEHPEIIYAQVTLALPNTIDIEVEERSPAIAWNDAGRTWWISLDGLAFIEHGVHPDLVRVETAEPVLNISEDALTPAIPPELVQSALDLSRELKDVEVLQFDPLTGFGFEDAHGWKVVFGVDGDMAMKVLVYRVLAEKLAAKGISVTLVNLENQAAPYYRIER